jgi:hypothetical protein
MQQFQTPNYYGQPYIQQQYNPYLQRMENLQQFQQAIQQPMVPTSMSGANQFTPLGKIVESMDIVKVTDIPMDGNMYYFPKADGTEIYAKQFGIDGKARILTFKPFLDDEPNNSLTNEEKLKFDDFNNVLMGIQEDIRTLNEKIDKISKPTRAKKEADNE